MSSPVLCTLDDIRLTGFCAKDTPLRILGGGVAERMGLNFFDVDNNSTLHRILHYPNYSRLLPHEKDFETFLEMHGLTKQEVHEAMIREGMEDSTHVPKTIVIKVLENYAQNPMQKRRSSLQDDMDKDAHTTLNALLEMSHERAKMNPYRGQERYELLTATEKETDLEAVKIDARRASVDAKVKDA